LAKLEERSGVNSTIQSAAFSIFFRNMQKLVRTWVVPVIEVLGQRGKNET
jgi:hypothetical protein